MPRSIAHKFSRRSFLKGSLIWLPAIKCAAESVIYRPWYHACHPTAIQWGFRVVNNGSNFPGPSTMIPVSNFLQTLDANNLTSRIYHCNIVAPDSIIAMRTPLIKTYGNDPWVRQTLGSPVAGDTVTISGWVPSADRANCYVYDTGVIPNNVIQWTNSNGGASVYISSSPTTNRITQGVLGTFDGTSYFDMRPDGAGFNTSLSFVFDASTGTSGTADHNGGFFLMSRTSSTVGVMYQARSNLGWAQLGTTDTATAGGKPTTSCYAGGDNYPSSTIHGSAVTYSWWGYHDGFSSADGQTLFNAVQALRVAMGGGFF